MADIESAVSILQEWRKETVDPDLKDHAARISDLEKYRASTEGKFTVICWLNGIILTLLVGLLIALFSWGLNQIKLKVSLEPQPTIGAAHTAPQSADGKYQFPQ